jgi:ABC-2 type transport system permease protein
MKTLQYYLTVYFMIVSQYIKKRLQYRADIAISTVGMFFLNITSFATLWILFRSITSLGGWSFNEILFLYGFALLSAIPLQLFFDNVWQLRSHITSGTFIKYYFRPLNMMFYYMSEVFDIKAVSQIFIAVGALIYSSGHLTLENGIIWNFSRIFLFCVLLSSSSLLIISLMIIGASSAFWIRNSFSIIEIIFSLKDYARYPVTVFGTVLKYMLSFAIPVAFAGYYPVQILVRPEEVEPVLFFSPVLGIIFFCFAYHIWEKGVRSYTGTGS